MEHVTVLLIDRRPERAAPRSSDCGLADSLERPLAAIEFDPASGAFDANAANYADHIPSGILKPKIYHDDQHLTPRAHRAPGRRESPRAGFHFREATGEQSELVGLQVNAQPSMSLAPDMAAHAGSSFHEPVAWMAEDASCDR
jgi:D-alanine-D-alanine ligase